MVLWLIGMSGAGKTTVAEQIYSRLKPSCPHLVMLDGDVIRECFGNDVGHTIEGRRKNAERLSKFSLELDRQGLHVISAVLSIFPEWRAWNREHFSNYKEIYLKVPFDTLVERDKKGLYKRAQSGEVSDVVGVDIAFPEPENADLTIDNSMPREDLSPLANQIIRHFNLNELN